MGEWEWETPHTPCPCPRPWPRLLWVGRGTGKKGRTPLPPHVKPVSGTKLAPLCPAYPGRAYTVICPPCSPGPRTDSLHLPPPLHPLRKKTLIFWSCARIERGRTGHKLTYKAEWRRAGCNTVWKGRRGGGQLFVLNGTVKIRRGEAVAAMEFSSLHDGKPCHKTGPTWKKAGWEGGKEGEREKDWKMKREWVKDIEGESRSKWVIVWKREN